MRGEQKRHGPVYLLEVPSHTVEVDPCRIRFLFHEIGWLSNLKCMSGLSCSVMLDYGMYPPSASNGFVLGPFISVDFDTP